MPANKLVIDLGKLNLTEKQRKNLQKALHRTVVSQLKKAQTEKDNNDDISANRDINITAKQAILSVTFTNTEINKSELTASVNDNKQTITKSGTITFSSVNSGDIIMVQATSLGTTTVTIDVSAEPVQLNFSPGHHNDQFFVN